MATIALLHGAGGRASQWDLVAPFLTDRGHEVVAVEMPCDQPAPLDAYVESVVAALAGVDGDVVLVAQSLAGLVAPIVVTRRPVAQLVLLAAMVPLPGESGGEWWGATGHAEAVAAQHLPDDSEETLFVHDVPTEVLARVGEPRSQTSTLFEDPWPLPVWPDVDTRFLLCRDDRFFPRDWLRALVHERLGIEPVEVPGSHCAYLSFPGPLAEAVLGCWADHQAGGRVRVAPGGRRPGFSATGVEDHGTAPTSG